MVLRDPLIDAAVLETARGGILPIATLLLVALMLAHYIIGGRWLKGVAAGRGLPSSKALRWFNELPVFLLLAIIWLVLAKPF